MTSCKYPESYENVPACQLLMEREVTQSGWMRKKSGQEKIRLTALSNYDKRYFIILKGWVYYYKDEKSDKPQGSFSLQGYSERVNPAEEEHSSALPFVFKVYPKSKDKRTWYFAPETEKLMNEWRNAFKYEIEKYNVAASRLRASVSLPERKNPYRLPLSTPHSDVTRPHSVNCRPKRNVSKNSMASSQSTSTSGSISSLPMDECDPDLMSQPWEQDGYEEFNPNPTIPEETNTTQFHNTFPSSPPFHASAAPPLPVRDVFCAEPHYDVIEDPPFVKKFAQQQLSPCQPVRPPLFLPNQSNEGEAKTIVKRIDSFPQQLPPDPPWPLVPDEQYVEPDVSPRHRLTSYQDKPLPPVPPCKDGASVSHGGLRPNLPQAGNETHVVENYTDVSEELLEEYIDTEQDILHMYDESFTDNKHNAVPNKTNKLQDRPLLPCPATTPKALPHLNKKPPPTPIKPTGKKTLFLPVKPPTPAKPSSSLRPQTPIKPAQVKVEKPATSMMPKPGFGKLDKPQLPDSFGKPAVNQNKPGPLKNKPLPHFTSSDIASPQSPLKPAFPKKLPPHSVANIGKIFHPDSKGSKYPKVKPTSHSPETTADNTEGATDPAMSSILARKKMFEGNTNVPKSKIAAKPMPDKKPQLPFKPKIQR